MNSHLIYFSYGSNMSEKRMKKRVPSATKIGTGILYNHKLLFHKRSKDGSGKCNAYFTEDKNDYVYGVLYKINLSEKNLLDRKEGKGHGYDDKKVKIKIIDDKYIIAYTYVATNIDDGLKPYTWYKEHVLRGAIENSFPKDYIEKIKSIKAKSDPDKRREQEEMSIYN